MSKSLRRTFAALTAAAVLVATPAFAAPTAVFLDGVQLDTKDEVRIVNSRTMMGLRDYFTAVGQPVDWDDATRTAKTSVNNQEIIVNPDTQFVSVNDKVVSLDVPPQIIEGHIYLPLRFFSETLGYKVDFKQEEARNEVYLESPQTEVKVPEHVAAFAKKAGTEESAYYIAGGRLVEMGNVGGRLMRHNLDMGSGDVVQEQKFTVGGSGGMLEARFDSDGKLALVHPKKQLSAGYVGPNTSAYVEPVAKLQTQSLGEVPMFETIDGSWRLRFEDLGIVEAGLRQDSYVLTLGGVQADTSERDYAVFPHKKTVFLVAGQLLFVDGTASNPLLAEVSTKGQKIMAVDQRVMVYGVDGNELSVGFHGTDGSVLKPYEVMSSTGAQGNLQIADIKTTPQEVLFLLTAGKQSYAVKVNLKAGVALTEKLPAGIPFTKLIPSADDNGYHALAVTDHGFYVDKNPLAVAVAS